MVRPVFYRPFWRCPGCGAPLFGIPWFRGGPCMVGRCGRWFGAADAYDGYPVMEHVQPMPIGGRETPMNMPMQNMPIRNNMGIRGNMNAPNPYVMYEE